MKNPFNDERSSFRSSGRVRNSFAPLVFAITLGAIPLVSSADTKGAASDAALTAEIKTRLMANDMTRGININVDSAGGTVTLRGTVPSTAAREKASEIAQSVAGERPVTNALLVGNSSLNPQTLSAKAKQAGERSGEVISDGWITTQVKTKLLSDDTIKGLDINVSTKDGEVVLAGLVPDEATREKAAFLAGNVEGVTTVNTEALEVD